MCFYILSILSVVFFCDSSIVTIGDMFAWLYLSCTSVFDFSSVIQSLSDVIILDRNIFSFIVMIVEWLIFELGLFYRWSLFKFNSYRIYCKYSFFFLYGECFLLYQIVFTFNHTIFGVDFMRLFVNKTIRFEMRIFFHICNGQWSLLYWSVSGKLFRILFFLANYGMVWEYQLKFINFDNATENFAIIWGNCLLVSRAFYFYSPISSSSSVQMFDEIATWNGLLIAFLNSAIRLIGLYANFLPPISFSLSLPFNLFLSPSLPLFLSLCLCGIIFACCNCDVHKLLNRYCKCVEVLFDTSWHLCHFYLSHLNDIIERILSVLFSNKYSQLSIGKIYSYLSD